MAPTPENAPCWHIPERPREMWRQHGMAWHGIAWQNVVWHGMGGHCSIDQQSIVLVARIRPLRLMASLRNASSVLAIYCVLCVSALRWPDQPQILGAHHTRFRGHKWSPVTGLGETMVMMRGGGGGLEGRVDAPWATSGATQRPVRLLGVALGYLCLRLWALAEMCANLPKKYVPLPLLSRLIHGNRVCCRMCRS